MDAGAEAVSRRAEGGSVGWLQNVHRRWPGNKID